MEKKKLFVIEAVIISIYGTGAYWSNCQVQYVNFMASIHHHRIIPCPL